MNAPTSILLVLAAQCLVPARCVPSFTINLDLAPKDRWVEVSRHYKKEFVAMGKALAPILRQHLGKDREEWLKIDFDEEYAAELQGIVDTVNDSDCSFDDLKLTNMIYELQSPVACSGVLLAQPDGTVVHGRNMDYGFHFKMPDGAVMNWPNVTFEATFTKAGKKLLTQTQWPGGVGLTTAMRLDNGWTIEQQTRFPNTWQENLKAAKEGGQLFGLALRKIMETTPRYQDAVDKVYATKFAAGQYFIMAGAGPFEGAVLTIDRLGKHLKDTPPIQKISDSKEGWRLVQTNDDLLHVPLDARRPIANQLLSATSQDDISEQGMMKFMHSGPLFQPSTVYSVVMVPKSGYYKTALPDELPHPLATVTSLADGQALVSSSFHAIKKKAQPKKRAYQKRGFLAVHSDAQF